MHAPSQLAAQRAGPCDVGRDEDPSVTLARPESKWEAGDGSYEKAQEGRARAAARCETVDQNGHGPHAWAGLSTARGASSTLDVVERRLAARRAPGGFAAGAAGGRAGAEADDEGDDATDVTDTDTTDATSQGSLTSVD